MTVYTANIRNYFGKGVATVVAHRNIDLATLEKWYNTTIKLSDLVDTSNIIAQLYKSCNREDFDTFMRWWINDHEERDTAHIATISDEYYGDLIVIGFDKGIADREYYIFEVK